MSVATPVRLQLSRRKGFSLQQWSREVNGLPAVNVARPSRFGNPVFCKRPHGCPHDPNFERDAWENDDGSISPNCCCVDAFRDWLEAGLRGEPSRTGYLSLAVDALAGNPRRLKLIASLPRLRGHNLACFCPLDDGPCHADVLLELAARP